MRKYVTQVEDSIVARPWNVATIAMLHAMLEGRHWMHIRAVLHHADRSALSELEVTRTCLHAATNDVLGDQTAVHASLGCLGVRSQPEKLCTGKRTLILDLQVLPRMACSCMLPHTAYVGPAKCSSGVLHCI